jgi:hypothetical protein
MHEELFILSATQSAKTVMVTPMMHDGVEHSHMAIDIVPLPWVLLFLGIILGQSSSGGDSA